LVALFTQRGAGNIRTLVLYRSANGGVSWSAPVTVASHTDANYAFGQASVAVSGSDVYVAWVETNKTAVKLRHSSNGGASFGATTTIGSLAYGDGSPTVAASGDNVYVLWGKYCPYFEGFCSPGMKTILLRRSLDGGSTWKPVQTITTETWLPLNQVAAAGKVLIMFVETGSSFKVWRSTNSGATFKSTVIAATGTYRDADGIVLVGSQARLVWTNTGAGDAYYRTSGDGGATWSSNAKVTPFNAYSVDDSRVALVGGRTVIVAFCTADPYAGWCDTTS
jgi:hypothetical protein